MLSGTGYPSGENYPAGTGMELFFYPHVGTGNPTGKILRVRVRVRVSTTRRVRTRCHLDSGLIGGETMGPGGLLIHGYYTTTAVFSSFKISKILQDSPSHQIF
jgi:hypothetical protein